MIREIAIKAKNASLFIQSISEEKRVLALKALADALLEHQEEILAENKKDLIQAQKNNLPEALVDRLTLTKKRIQDLAQMCREIATGKQVVGVTVEESTRPNGLIVQKQRVPIGVMAMIFESRPNVMIDGAALAIKSGNAIILKGGKEAQYSNRALFKLLEKATSSMLPQGAVSLVETRADVGELLKLDEFINLVVARGGSDLVSFVKNHATMPVIAHDKGLCHMYVHADADPQSALDIILNAKTQRPGVCNALETLLLHQDFSQNKEVICALINAGVEILGCSQAQALHEEVKEASPEDFKTEHLSKRISLKIVSSLREGITHIQQHSSHHTEGILARDTRVIDEFTNSIDASAIVINTSTRFNDGGELGLGAELGISTSKLHAYGPMGAEQMTTTRFIVKGKGQIRK